VSRPWRWLELLAFWLPRHGARRSASAGLCLDQWWIQRGIGGLASSLITCLGAGASAEDLLLLRPPRSALVAREEAQRLVGVCCPSPGRPWWRGGLRVDAFDLFFFVDSGAVHASVGFSRVCSDDQGGCLKLVVWEPAAAVSVGASLWRLWRPVSSSRSEPMV
jgi:hypothetical protein